MAPDQQALWQDTPPAAQRLVAVLGRLVAVMRSDAWRATSVEGLTPTQADLLALLAGRASGARLGWLAEQLRITSATASDAVASLVAKGWVQKARALDDARALSLSLTRTGRTLARRLGAPSGVVEVALGSLPLQTQDQLLAGLLQLVGELQRNQDFPELRTCVTCEHFEAHRHADVGAPHHCHLVGAALPARLLRVDCPEHVAASRAVQAGRWQALRA